MISDDNKFLDISKLSITLGFVDKKTGKPLNYILRFWETKFSQIKPTKLKGNRRYYSIKQIERIKLIKYLLKDKKMTIEGAKKILNSDINKLDEYTASSITNDYYQKKIKIRTKKILEKIKLLKKHGKKNTS